MKWLTTTLAAAVITSAFAAPAFAEHPKRDRGLDRHQAVNQVMRSFKKVDRNRDGPLKSGPDGFAECLARFLRPVQEGRIEVYIGDVDKLQHRLSGSL